jgi:hypothetical protein
VEFVDDHVSVADDPSVTLGWLIASVTAGAGVAGVAGTCATGDPPPPPPPHAANDNAINPAPIDFFIHFLHSHLMGACRL